MRGTGRQGLVAGGLWLLCGLLLGLAVHPGAATGKGSGGQAGAAPAVGHSGAAGAAPAPEAGRPPLPTLGSAGLAPVAHLNLGRFAGVWYDVAATPDRFHEGCAADALTLYSLIPEAGRESELRVENRCHAADGHARDAAGILRIQHPGALASRLQLRYAPDWMAWFPLAWSEVWVIGLDAGYRYAVMATPDREHLWILSRTPRMADADFAAAMARARALGFGTARLRRISQDGALALVADAPG